MMPEFEERALFWVNRGERPLSSRGLLQEALEAVGWLQFKNLQRAFLSLC